MRRRLVVLLVTVTMALIGTQAASAAVTSSISIGYNATTMHFHGKVSSADIECIAGRTVKVFKKTSTGNTLEGKTTSNKSGGWKVDVMHAHGKYIAVTPKQKIMTTQCGRARSSTVDVM
jgi:hypothetical protein